MQYISKIKERFPGDQFFLLTICLSLVLPYYLCGPYIVCMFIYLLKKGKLTEAYNKTPQAKYLIIFTLLSSLVSLFYRNWVGVASMAGIFVVLSLTLYYRQHITKDLFEYVLDALILASVFWMIVSLYQEWQIIERLNDGIWTLHVYSQRQNRITGVFYNANYYAMMLEFVILCIVYKFTQVKNNTKKECYYILLGLMNLFVLYMTGCRTAYIAIAGALLIYMIFSKNYFFCGFITFIICACILFFIMNPQLFPRIVNLVANFGVRMNIWNCAIQGIKAHPLFGQGPFTYVLIRDIYNGHMTQHAHSVYLDPLLSFGIVGLATLVPFVISNTKQMLSVYKQDRWYVALVLSFITIVLLHGIFDYTIMWLHTGVFFLFMMVSHTMIKNNEAQ